MIRLWIGKAHSGKTYGVYKALKNAIESGLSHETLLIVPEQYTLEAEKQFIHQTGLEGVLGLEIVSIKRLVHKVIKEVGGEPFVHITETGKRMLLRKLFREKAQDLSIYKTAFDKTGFIEQFYGLIQELKSGMVSVEDLENILSRMDHKAILYHKLHDIAIIYSAYLSVQKSGYYDEEDLNALLMTLIPKSDWLRETHLFVDGFDSFTKQEYGILKALAANSKAMTITLTTDMSRASVFNHNQRALSAFEDMAEHLGLELEIKHFDRAPSSPRIEHVASQLMAYPYEKNPFKKGQIFCFSAGSVQSEVAFCAVEILRCVREQGYDWKDIAVVTNALSQYESALQRTFEQHDIPFFLDLKTGVMTNPLVQFILSACQFLVVKKGEQHLMRFLKTGLLGLDPDQVYALELYVRANGLNLFKPFYKPALEGFSLEYLEALRASLEVHLRPLKTLLSQATFKVRDGVTVLFDLLMAYGVYEQMMAFVASFNERLAYDEAQQFTQMWNATMSLFDELVALIGDEQVDSEGFIKLLETGFEAVEVGRLPLDENRVLIGTLDRSKAHPIKALFIVGVNDGTLPEVGSDTQLIQDREKEHMAELGYRLLSDNKMFLDKEAFNVYMAFSRPSEQLFVSTAKADAEGQTIRPSYLIAKLGKIDPSVKMVEEQRAHLDASGYPYWVSSKKFTAQFLARTMRGHMDGYETNAAWEDVFLWYAKNDADKAKQLLEGLAHSNRSQNLSPETIEALYAPPIKTSVSRLEEYVQCPFKYFVSSGLKPQIVKPFRMDYPDVGILFHSTLEAFGKAILSANQSWPSLSDAQCEALVENIVEGIVDQDVFRSKFAYRYMIQKLKRVSKRAVKTLTYQLRQGDFEPIAYEMLFSDGLSGVPPIYIELANGQSMLLRGVIDRVDLLKTEEGQYIKIIDYKSGSKSWSLTDVYYGLQMQLMVYLKACLGNPSYFKADALYPAGAFYFKIDDPFVESTEQVKEKVVTELQGNLKLDGLCLDAVEVLKHLDIGLFEQGASDVIKVKLKNTGEFTKDSKVIDLAHFNALMVWTEKNIQAIGNALLQGEINAYPCRSGAFVSCDFCNYGALCQFDTRFEDNRYKVLKPMDDEAVLKAIETEEAENVDE